MKKRTPMVTAAAFAVLTLLSMACQQKTAIERFSKPGIWVLAICGDVIADPKKACDVFFASEADYQKYARDWEKAQYEPRGKTPFFIEDPGKGVFYVGIKAILSKQTSDIRFDASGQTEGPSQRVCDDAPAEAVATLRIAPEEGLSISITKWYRVEKADEGVIPVVGLFLNKHASLTEWEKYYPDQPQFIIKSTPNQISEFWETLKSDSSQATGRPRWPDLTPAESETILRLLKKGGRVPLPEKVGTGAVYLNGLLNIGATFVIRG